MLTFLVSLGFSFPRPGQCDEINLKYETQKVTFSNTKCVFGNFIFATNNRVKTLVYNDPSQPAKFEGEQYRCVTSGSPSIEPDVELQCMESSCTIEIVKISPTYQPAVEGAHQSYMSFIDTRPYSLTANLYSKYTTTEGVPTQITKDLMILRPSASFKFTNQQTSEVSINIFNDEHVDSPDTIQFTSGETKTVELKQSVMSIFSHDQTDKSFLVEFPAATQTTMFPAFYGMIPLAAGAYTYQDLVNQRIENEPKPKYPFDDDCATLDPAYTVTTKTFNGKLCSNISFMMEANQDIEIKVYDKKDYDEYILKNEAYKNVLLVAPNTNESKINSIITCKKDNCDLKYITVPVSHIGSFESSGMNVSTIFNTYLTTYQSGSYLLNQSIQIRKNEFHVTVYTPYVVPFGNIKYTFLSDLQTEITHESSNNAITLEKDKPHDLEIASAIYPSAFASQLVKELKDKYDAAADKDNFMSEVKHLTINLTWNPAQKAASADTTFPEFHGYIPLGAGVVTYTDYKNKFSEKEPEDPNDPDPQTESTKTPTPEPAPENKGLSPGAIAGIVIGCIGAVVIVAVVIFFAMKNKGSISSAVNP